MLFLCFYLNTGNIVFLVRVFIHSTDYFLFRICVLAFWWSLCTFPGPIGLIWCTSLLMKLQYVAAQCCLYRLLGSTAEVFFSVLDEGLCIFPRERHFLLVSFLWGFVYFLFDEVAVVDLLVLLLLPPCTILLLWYTSIHVLLLLLLLLHSHRVLLLISELFLPCLSPLGTEYAAAHR